MSGIRLSAAVLTHPARVDHARRLRDRHPDLDLQVVVDPAPGEGHRALHESFRRAWRAVAPDATHHLVVEDDTVLCGSFRQQLRQAIAARPDQALSLYVERGSETSYVARIAALVGSAWAEVVDAYVPTQALVLPAEVARGFGGYHGDDAPLPDFTMRVFLASVGVSNVVTVPNLAECAQLPTVSGHEFLGRMASVCFFEELDAEVDWHASAAAPETVPAFSWSAGQAYCIERSHAPGQRWQRRSVPVAPAGRSREAVTALASATIRRWPTLISVAGLRLLLGLWLTGHGLGLAAARLGAGRMELERVLARPLVRQSLATMPAGALRFLLDDHHIDTYHQQFTELVETSLRQGFRAEASCLCPPPQRETP